MPTKPTGDLEDSTKDETATKNPQQKSSRDLSSLTFQFNDFSRIAPTELKVSPRIPSKLSTPKEQPVVTDTVSETPSAPVNVETSPTTIEETTTEATTQQTTNEAVPTQIQPTEPNVPNVPTP